MSVPALPPSAYTHAWHETQARFLHLNCELAEAFAMMAQEARQGGDWHRFERHRGNAESAHSSVCEILDGLQQADPSRSQPWSERCRHIGAQLASLR